MRFLSQKAKEPVLSTQAKNTIGLEKESKLYQHDLGRNWQLKIKKSMLEFGAAIKKLKFKGAEIICYGAPTKATLLLKLSELTSEEINYMLKTTISRLAISFQPQAFQAFHLKDSV